MTKEQLFVLAPPKDWEWVRRPTLRASGSVRCPSLVQDIEPTALQPLLKALFDWALANDLGLAPPSELQRRQSITRWYHRNIGASGHVYNTFTVKANQPDWTAVRVGQHRTPCCGAAVNAEHVFCGTCYTGIWCAECSFTGMKLHPVEYNGRQQSLCANCTKPCDTKGCTQRIRRQGTTVKKCHVCEPLVYCEWCDKTVAEAEAHVITPPQLNSAGRVAVRGTNMCNACYDKRKCPKCLTWNQYLEIVTRDGEKMCRMCADAEDAKALEADRVFPADELPISGDLVVPSTKQRPFRTISIETEMNGDGGFIARQLYRCGFVNAPAVQSYGSHQPADDSHVSFLKHDGSVTGGELITGRIHLDERDEADALLQVLGAVRALEKAGKAQFTEVCGGHMHIDSHNLNYSDAWRKITVYNYLENPIYRLGGAGTGPLRLHRTLIPGHDAANGGRGYSNEVIKGPFGTQSTFGRSLQQMDRMCGLNFQHFLHAREKCRCGAISMENSKDCTCNLGKSTIEWRVWNSTGNPRILHAWIALMQAITAFADSETPMTAQEEERYPTFAWDRKRFEMSRHGKETKERLEWIHTQLPLTLAERDSIVFAAKHSELKELGDEYLESLLTLENNSTVPEKKGVRNPNRRERKILIQPPSPGDAVPFNKKGFQSPPDPSRVTRQIRFTAR